MDYTSIVIEVANGKVVGVYGRDKNIDVEVLIDVTDDELDEMGDELIAQHPFILYNPKEVVGTCRFCGSPLYKSKVFGYEYECLKCDEDFYAFEQE